MQRKADEAAASAFLLVARMCTVLLATLHGSHCIASERSAAHRTLLLLSASASLFDCCCGISCSIDEKTAASKTSSEADERQQNEA